MLYWIYTLWKDAQVNGAEWAETFSFLRLLGYITLRAGFAATLAFALTLALGGRVIRKLISLKVGQPIRTAAEVHKLAELHGGKAGTPTMGGIMILGTMLIAVLVCGDITNPFLLVTLAVTFALGVLGFLDDYKKIVKKSSDGVSGKMKLLWQAAVGLGATVFLLNNPLTSEYLFYSGGKMIEPTTAKVTSVSFPLLTFVIPLGLLAIPFFVALLMGPSNAVNLTDGLDGLATGVTITVALSYAVITYHSNDGACRGRPRLSLVQLPSRKSLHGRYRITGNWWRYWYDGDLRQAGAAPRDHRWRFCDGSNVGHPTSRFLQAPGKAHLRNGSHSSSFRTPGLA